MEYSFKSEDTADRIIEYTIFDITKFFKTPICICITNRKYVKLSTIKDQIMIFDLCAKSFKKKVNISTQNVCIIYDIRRLTMDDMSGLVLRYIKEYNYDVDILFCDKFGILHHQLISERLFKNEIVQKNNLKNIKFYCLYNHTNTYKDCSHVFIEIIEYNCESYLENYSVFTFEIICSDRRFILEIRKISFFPAFQALINSFELNSNFTRTTQISRNANFSFDKQTCLNINGIVVDLKLYLQNDSYTLNFINRINCKHDINTMLVIDITNNSSNYIGEFTKKIEIICTRENNNAEKMHKLHIIVYEDNLYTKPIEYLLLEDENQQTFDINHNTKINNSYKNYNLMVKKLIINLKKLLQYYDLLKNQFHITTKHWIGNESIILQGRKKTIQTILNINNQAELNKCKHDII